MNILQALLREHSKAMCDRIVRYVGKDPARFGTLVEVFLTGPYRVTQRASWPLSCCVEIHPELIKPHLKKIMGNLQTPGLHVAVKRNTIRLLQFITIPKSMQGPVAQVCFSFLGDPKQTIAVRVFSMTVLTNLSKEQPGLKREVRMIIEDQLPYATAGFIARAKRELRKLGKV